MTGASSLAGRPARLRDLPAAVRVALRAEAAAYAAGRNGALRAGFGWRTTIGASVVFATLLGWEWISADRAAVVTVTPVPGWPARPWRAVTVAAVGFAGVMAFPAVGLGLLGVIWWVGAATAPHLYAGRRRRPVGVAGWAPFGAGRPVWYLGGAASGGEGAGRPLWGALFAAADRRGVVLVVETSGEQRIGYYRTGGFEVVAEGRDGNVVLTRAPAGPPPAAS